ncbi:hypothetical protein P865_08050 [Brucella abortus 82]|nr:hypothetical protein P408_09595 [Brucella abortus S99]ERM86467.1 hypothetical protein P865_08050 [Brucella abortus 82]EXU84242.1 hypothetical protein AX23_15690 [Brucella melitensis 548]
MRFERANVPKACIFLLKGDNFGKLIMKLA